MEYLISQKMIREYERSTGLKWEKGRRTGRSTAIALKTISQAITQPGEAWLIVDHFGSREADRHLARTIVQVLAVLGLKGMTINWHELTLTFHLYEPACVRCRCSACEEQHD